MDVVVIGGSAVTSHAPALYTSDDIDFAVLSGVRQREIAASLAKLGFSRAGRSYAHPDLTFTLDFVADWPLIEAEPVKHFFKIETPFGPYDTLTVEDAIADRVASFVHWNDRQGLDVALALAASTRERWGAASLESALSVIDPGDAASSKRLRLACDLLITSSSTL